MGCANGHNGLSRIDRMEKHVINRITTDKAFRERMKAAIIDAEIVERVANAEWRPESI